ncbi:hypothetical protein T4B_15253 [Trichinella pseudospiralis]|uniref:Uncharacterized protein n=1 Tax=Trichinella pseudospiralis TaxID=6337 RepID=A0A0V1IKH8_TRIPS|nr:hypothetical protein T4B_15253 [Trichinella pseudospiralis]
MARNLSYSETYSEKINRSHLTTHNRRVIAYCPDRLEMFINYSEMENLCPKQIRYIDDYRFNRKYCLVSILKCTFKKIFSNCDHWHAQHRSQRQQIAKKALIYWLCSCKETNCEIKKRAVLFSNLKTALTVQKILKNDMCCCHQQDVNEI